MGGKGRGGGKFCIYLMTCINMEHIGCYCINGAVFQSAILGVDLFDGGLLMYKY